MPANEPRPSWMMGGITNPAVEQYLYSLLPERDPVLREMEEAAARRKIPIVGPAVGRLLFQFAQMIEAQSIFELGSAIGYSTLWWARALPEPGRITYTDSSRANADEARGYFQRASVADKIQILVGDALELLSEHSGPFDIIFVDVDKEDYPRALRLAVPRLRKGGLLIADNALWSGKVANPQDDDSRAVVEFNRAVYAHKDLVTTILPLRDGIALGLKT